MLSFIASFVAVPPISFLLLALLGVVIGLRRRLGRIVATIGLMALFVLAMPLTSKLLLASLETDLPLMPPADAPPEAIVVLGGDAHRVPRAPYLVAGALSLERERAAVALARRTKLPLLVTGGSVDPHGPPIAELMAASLSEDFETPPRWIERVSADTWGNARLSADLLRTDGIRSVYVVTQAWHMRRALIAFRAAGLIATAAPTYFDSGPDWDWHELIPLVSSWMRGYYALHEWIGCAFYALRARAV